MIDNEYAAAPAVESRKGEGKMTESELEAIVSHLIQSAVQYTDGELSPAREVATDYYLGKPFGNEEDGRSQVVLTEVRDAVSGTLPGMLKVIFGAEHVVEYTPQKPEDEAGAQQATDYARLVWEQDNPGFMIAHSAIKDGLVRKLGIVKWRWDDQSVVKGFCLEHVDEEQLASLLSDPDVELTSGEEEDAPDAETGSRLFKVEGTRRESDGRLEILAVPPEEFIFDPNARTLETATFVGHRTELARGDLLAMGISKKILDEIGDGSTRDLIDNPEAQARRAGSVASNPEAGDANDKILYVEGYIRVDFDGDGIPELRQVRCVGPAYTLADDEPKLCDELPFAYWCPDPEPHTIVGGSLADRTMDMQLYKSSLIRAISDSAALSLFPRTAYVEGQVSVADILNTEIGAPIRMSAIGMAQPFTHPFMGGDLLPLLAYADDIVERRTGQNKGTMGLDADALQSSTQSAVGAAVSSAQQQTELYVRLFAEQLLRPLFRGILRTFIAYQPRKRMVKLRGKWVQIDPRAWNADMSVKVNLTLGSGLLEEKLGRLAAIVAKQELILTTLGPSNPIVSLAQYATALREATQISGFFPDKYFNAVDPNWQPPQQQPQPDPNMALVQIEAQKAQTTAVQKMQELQLKQSSQEQELSLKERQMQQDAELQREKMQLEYNLKLKELELKYQVELHIKELEAELAQRVEGSKLELEERKASTQTAIERERLEREDARAERDSQRKTEVAREANAAKASEQKPEPKAAPAPAPQIKIDNHIHIPKRGPATVERDEKGNVTGIRESDDK